MRYFLMGAVALLVTFAMNAMAGPNDPQKWTNPPAGWIEIYAGKKFVGYADPNAPGPDYSRFCNIQDPMCMLDLDGPDEADDDN